MRHFGPVPGIAPGTLFDSRAALSVARIHRPRIAGISGSALDGADSIVISGGYEDDRDEGDTLIYTGHGGNDRITRRQIADQELRYSNAALVKSCQQRLPVRVTRGASVRSRFSPPFGYRYDGIYNIEEYWSETGKSGYLVWRFLLARAEDA